MIFDSQMLSVIFKKKIIYLQNYISNTIILFFKTRIINLIIIKYTKMNKIALHIMILRINMLYNYISI